MTNIPENSHRKLADFQSEWVCNRLKQLRYLACLSLTVAGERLQCDPKTVASVERGRYAAPFLTIAAYVSAYGVSLADFFAQCPTKVSMAQPASKAKGIKAQLDSIAYAPDAVEADRFEKFMRSKYPHLSSDKMEDYRRRQRSDKILSMVNDNRAANKAKRKKS